MDKSDNVHFNSEELHQKSPNLYMQEQEVLNIHKSVFCHDRHLTRIDMIIQIYVEERL